MFKVGDKVRVLRTSDTSKYIFNVGEEFEIVKIGNYFYEDIAYKEDNVYGIRFKDIELVEEEIWHDGSGRSGNLFNIEIPKIPNIDIPKLAQNLYEGTQREMKLYSVKELHREIKNIYFNEGKRTTVIVFKNGDKVKATASKDTPFSEYAGFVTALFKYEKGLKLKDVEHLIKKKSK